MKVVQPSASLDSDQLSSRGSDMDDQVYPVSRGKRLIAMKLAFTAQIMRKAFVDYTLDESLQATLLVTLPL